MAMAVAIADYQQTWTSAELLLALALLACMHNCSVQYLHNITGSLHRCFHRACMHAVAALL
jgi:hypothetical protein